MEAWNQENETSLKKTTKRKKSKDNIKKIYRKNIYRIKNEKN